LHGSARQIVVFKNHPAAQGAGIRGIEKICEVVKQQTPHRLKEKIVNINCKLNSENLLCGGWLCEASSPHTILLLSLAI